MSNPLVERPEKRGFALRRFALCAFCVAALASSHAASAAEVLVAVATNFAAVLEQLEPDFEAKTGHELRRLSGSTGKLYAQILHGAPYHVLLAADRDRPARLVEAGVASASSRRTYAIGRLALWSADSGRVAADGRETLRRKDFRRLALANPDLAPYGAAALETLQSLGLEEVLRDRLVKGEDVGQTYALVATGNAELGFVSVAQIWLASGSRKGSHWLVPEDLHAPIRQDAVLLEAGKSNPAATAFLDYLASEPAREMIRGFGYAVE